MAYTITQLKDDLERKLHGTTLDKIADPDALINEGARNLLARIDPQETKRTTQITNAVYDDVFSYAVPSDLKGDKWYSILPQANPFPGDNLSQVYGENFELYKDRTKGIADIEYNSGVKTLRLSISGGRAGKTMHTMDSITDNGTWAVTGDGSNLTRDALTKLAGSASLRFDLDSSGSQALLTNSTFSAIDGTDELDVGSFFVPIFMPEGNDITSFGLRWGSDASNYWEASATTASDTTAFGTGWNLVRFDWDGATKVLSPDETALDFLRVAVNYAGTATQNVRVDNIVLRLGEIYDFKYYSKFLFSTSAGVFGETITADTDTVNLDTDSYNCLLYEVAFLAAQEIQGEDGVFDRNFWQEKMDKEYKNYTDNYRSETVRSQSNYNKRLYNPRRPARGRIFRS